MGCHLLSSSCCGCNAASWCCCTALVSHLQKVVCKATVHVTLSCTCKVCSLQRPVTHGGSVSVPTTEIKPCEIISPLPRISSLGSEVRTRPLDPHSMHVPSSQGARRREDDSKAWVHQGCVYGLVIIVIRTHPLGVHIVEHMRLKR
jgi:hypothetical protein